jgi:hypothetical protein
MLDGARRDSHPASNHLLGHARRIQHKTSTFLLGQRGRRRQTPGSIDEFTRRPGATLEDREGGRD